MKNTKDYIWHTMEENIFPDQMIYLWNGKETSLSSRKYENNTFGGYLVFKDGRMSLNDFKDESLKDCRWAYVNQDLELRPSPKPEFGEIKIDTLNISAKLLLSLKAVDGLNSIQDILDIGKKGLFKIRGFGVISFNELQVALDKYGIDLNKR